MSLENTKLLITPNGYKAGKLYSALPESGAGDSIFERATTATRVNADGLIEEVGLNVPRVDYPVLGGCPSLLLEPQRTNLLSYSEEFDNSIWIKSNAIIDPNATTAPDGTLTADKLVESVGTNNKQIFQLLSSSNKVFTFSVFAKKGERDILQIVLGGSAFEEGAVFANFDLTNATIPLGVFLNAYIISFNDDWYKCTISATPLAAATISVSLQPKPLTTSTRAQFYQGDGTSGVFIWGAQIEEGTQASSYIPTVASSVTRNTDVLSNNMIATVDSTYTALLDVSASDSRLKIEGGTTGFDLPLNGSGRIVMVVDSDIKFYFPDNGQATTVLTYAKPSDLRNIDVLSKINETKIKVIAVENGVALQSRINSWVSGIVSSYFIDTDWSLEASFTVEFRNSDWDYFPLINTSNGTSFQAAWFNNSLTSFPRLNMDKGTSFADAWRDNNLITWLPNYFDTCVGTNFDRAWLINAIDQTGVDNILVSINTARLAGVQTGTTKVIGLNGGTNATPSATGQAATDALRADGWTVNLNGY
ncbi:hypothetical protein P12024L_10 [Nonlabens phage P12024L]|uniref:Uncharacterized protein n=1 Tax=Nonlabens phage P12024L TaxID=1168479 RepID=I6S6R9_9CAUD|nr:hypothetical protein B618_gp10 [Nonlabens phage P12024L]AFM54730.1 hypothetical protein P12024L_10 [Nonlabens phage P12024L]